MGIVNITIILGFFTMIKVNFPLYYYNSKKYLLWSAKKIKCVGDLGIRAYKGEIWKPDVEFSKKTKVS